jgi:hypothetical protein
MSMAGFWIIDLTATGEIRLKQEYEYRFLEEIPGAIDLIAMFSSHVWRAPDEFVANLPGGHLVMRWRACSDTSGIATLWYRDQLASLSILLTGGEPDGGADTLVPVQKQLVRELHDTGFEPAFDLMHIAERPLSATLNIRAPDEAGDQLVFALADRCFAASYFRKMGLA